MACFIEVKVVPSAGRQQCKREGDRLKCFLKSPAQKSKANKELIAYLAKILSIARQDITIRTGAWHTHKRIKIETDKTFEQLCGMLNTNEKQ